MFTKFLLAILVAVCMNGCYWIDGNCTGEGTGPLCMTDGSVNSADSSADSNDGSTDNSSKSDGNSSPETAGPKLEEVCKNSMFLQGTNWLCHQNWDNETVLKLAVNNQGVCLISGWYDGGKRWQVLADSIVFHTPDQLVWDMDKYGEPLTHGVGPKVCDKIK